MFTNDCIKEVYESEHVSTATKLLRIILDAKYEKSDLHKIMESQCRHLTMIQRNEFLKLFQIFEELFDGILGNLEMDPVYFELKRIRIQYARDHTQYQRYMKKCSKRRLSGWFY